MNSANWPRNPSPSVAIVRASVDKSSGLCAEVGIDGLRRRATYRVRRGEQPSDRISGCWRQEFAHTYPDEANFAELLFRARLGARKEASGTGRSVGTPQDNIPASKEIQAMALIDAITWRPRLAEPYPRVAHATSESLPTSPGADVNPLRMWGNFAYEIINVGGTVGKAQRNPMNDILVPSAAA